MAQRFRKSVNWRQVVTITLIVLVGIGLLIGVAQLLDDDHTVMNVAFAKGALDEQGKFAESDTSIYLKDAISITNLNVKRDFDASVSYRIVFYDENMEFVGETEELTANWNIKNHADSVAEGAKYCRIVIDAQEVDENGKVSSTELLKYAGQLTITYTK